MQRNGSDEAANEIAGALKYWNCLGHLSCVQAHFSLITLWSLSKVQHLESHSIHSTFRIVIFSFLGPNDRTNVPFRSVPFFKFSWICVCLDLVFLSNSHEFQFILLWIFNRFKRFRVVFGKLNFLKPLSALFSQTPLLSFFQVLEPCLAFWNRLACAFALATLWCIIVWSLALLGIYS